MSKDKLRRAINSIKNKWTEEQLKKLCGEKLRWYTVRRMKVRDFIGQFPRVRNVVCGLFLIRHY